ncbi:flagellar biosynthesis protein FlhG [Mobilisporobacter senegalensis]|uniref:Flagellar biosynthesis protein FlhG n=1 Tax=Mobilisporobacter senegalensis TaxID=1329262 RepID=A0A3N1XVY0_9FIRM|nr:MinD/ParA family protein [Mobilisporobacter senegalensis]ROR30785.1 flagellar biosynthesis protein FlhG [Mobilisporobacter senegalensis]
MDQAENLRNIIKKSNQRLSNARVITVTSGKGGVGKSSVSVNLALQLKRLGKRVVIIDADFGLANVEVMFGIRPIYNLADLIYHGKNIKEIITKGPEDIGFISGGSGIQELSNLNREQIVSLTKNLGELDEIADVIIIDTGAGISESVLEFVIASSEVLLVVTPEPTSITDAYALLKTLNKNAEFCNENTVIKIVTNRVASANDGKELFHKLSVVVQKFLNIQLEYLGAIPQDNNVSKAVMQQKPFSLIYPTSTSSKAIFDLANNLNSDDIPIKASHNRGISSLFSNLLRVKTMK